MKKEKVLVQRDAKIRAQAKGPLHGASPESHGKLQIELRYHTQEAAVD
jgi:hypothetical protein